MTRATIRTRLILLSSVLLAVLVATNFYLSRRLSENSARTAETAELLKTIEQATSAQIAFGEVRYWMTDLAVSLLTLSERKADQARTRMEGYLDQLAPRKPERIVEVRRELAQYEDLAKKAVDAYTDDRRVIGNSILAQARQHSLVVDQLLSNIVAELTGEVVAARDRAVAEAAAATRLSQLVVTAAVLVGALLTFLVLRSIAGPLRRLVIAMDGLNAGDTAVAIPAAGPDEIGAMALTLAAFRDTMTELRETLARNAKLIEEQRRREAELRAAHEELKATQANLIQSEKMASLGQLTAGIAHEIKNPLNFVNNFADLSRELLDELKETAGPAIAHLEAGPREDTHELMDTLDGNLSKIAEHGRRADGIVKSMLMHSRGETGERQSVDFNALVEEALNLAYHGARAQDPSFNISIERALDPSLLPVTLVPPDVTRVLLNLIGNGFYAATKRRRDGADAGFSPVLKVTTRDLGEQVEVRVRDNGVGMPPAVQEKIFAPFFTTKPTGEGTGLGLSISYDIVVREHGGTITVDSREGEFAEFTVRLPRQVRAERRQEAMA